MIQSEAVDNLLRILDAYPHTIDVIRAKHHFKLSPAKVRIPMKTDGHTVEVSHLLRAGAAGC